MISVVVPVYNSPRISLQQAKASLDAQTHRDFEVVWIDDGSKEETAKVLDGFASERHRVIHQRNAGVYEARWNGVKEAKGEYITFLDADDYLEKDALSLMDEEAKKHDSDLVIASFYLEKLGKKGKPWIFRGKKEPLDPYRFSLKFFTGIKIRGFVWGRLYKKSLLESLLPFPYPKRLFEDACIAYLTGVKAKNVVYLSSPCYHYVVGNGESLTGKPNPRRLEDHLYAFTRIKEMVLETGDQKLWKTFEARLWIVSQNLAFDKRLSIRAGLNKKEANRIYKEGMARLKTR